MIILGVNDSHNSSACFYEDGRVVAAVSEERLRRVKNWTGYPEKALLECLRITGRKMEDVDCLAVAGLGGGLLSNTREDVISMYRNGVDLGVKYWVERAKKTLTKALYKGHLRSLYQATALRGARDAARRRGRIAKLLEIGVPEDKIVLVGHHLAHAASAYYGWARFDEDILVLTNDGSGDRICATVNVGRNGRLECIAEIDDTESIGFIYSMTTCLLGMVPLEHEYKLMGMAPYAEQKGAELVYKDLKAIFGFDGPKGLSWSRRNGCPEAYCSYRYLQNLFELKRFDSICAGLQRFTQEFIAEWVRNCIQATGIRKVALSGGIFMNVKMNKAIMELPEVEDLFVFPSCGDESNAFGAAYYAYAQREDSRSMQPLGDLYKGPEYDDEQIARACGEYSFNNRVSIERVERIEETTAELLARGEVVARFSGREEFGARALGNRSILADASRPEVVKVLNDAIKSRDFWMPFAPSVLDRRQDDYFVNPKKVAAPYMMMSFDSTKRIDEFRAACHPYDLTLRPQVVYRDWNPAFYALLESFERKTGRGILLNTSFNLHGYPIVSHPADALRVFDESGLMNLAIGGYLLKKVE
jgi:carbamoyltransferase